MANKIFSLIPSIRQLSFVGLALTFVACSTPLSSGVGGVVRDELPPNVSLGSSGSADGDTLSGRGLISRDGRYFALPTQIRNRVLGRRSYASTEVFDLRSGKKVSNVFDVDTERYSGGRSKIDEPFSLPRESFGLFQVKRRRDRTTDLCVIVTRFSADFAQEEFCIDDEVLGPKFRTVRDRVVSPDGRYLLVVGSSVPVGMEPSMDTIRPAFKVLDLENKDVVSAGHSLDGFGYIPFKVGDAFLPSDTTRFFLGLGHTENFEENRFNLRQHRYALGLYSIDTGLVEEGAWGELVLPRGELFIADQSADGRVAWFSSTCLEFGQRNDCLRTERRFLISSAEEGGGQLSPQSLNNSIVLANSVHDPEYSEGEHPTYHGAFLGNDYFVKEFEFQHDETGKRFRYSKIYKLEGDQFEELPGTIPGSLLAASKGEAAMKIVASVPKFFGKRVAFRVFEFTPE